MITRKLRSGTGTLKVIYCSSIKLQLKSVVYDVDNRVGLNK